jgi:hypothetical protein
MWDAMLNEVVPLTCPPWFPALVEDFPTESEAEAAARARGAGAVTGWRACLFIGTLEGVHRADPGDWIIQGIKGELYPCKPDIFAATYEPA